MHTLVLLYMGDETVTASAGTERVLTNMANAFVERGYRTIVVTNDPILRCLACEDACRS